VINTFFSFHRASAKQKTGDIDRFHLLSISIKRKSFLLITDIILNIISSVVAANTPETQSSLMAAHTLSGVFALCHLLCIIVSSFVDVVEKS